MMHVSAKSSFWGMDKRRAALRGVVIGGDSIRTEDFTIDYKQEWPMQSSSVDITVILFRALVIIYRWPKSRGKGVLALDCLNRQSVMVLDLS